MEIIVDNGIVRGRQDYVLDRVYRLDNDMKVRVYIKRDSYDFQSYAKAEYWDGAKWSYVVGRQGTHPKMKDLPSYTTNDERSRDAALEDIVEDLLEGVIAVLD